MSIRCYGLSMNIAAFTDGSGAPAMVSVRGWTFQLDYLGEVTCSLATVSSSRKPPKWAAEWARKAYLAELTAAVTPEWFVANRAMYSAEVPS